MLALNAINYKGIKVQFGRYDITTNDNCVVVNVGMRYRLIIDRPPKLFIRDK